MFGARQKYHNLWFRVWLCFESHHHDTVSCSEALLQLFLLVFCYHHEGEWNIRRAKHLKETYEVGEQDHIDYENYQELLVTTNILMFSWFLYILFNCLIKLHSIICKQADDPQKPERNGAGCGAGQTGARQLVCHLLCEWVRPDTFSCSYFVWFYIIEGLYFFHTIFFFVFQISIQCSNGFSKIPCSFFIDKKKKVVVCCNVSYVLRLGFSICVHPGERLTNLVTSGRAIRNANTIKQIQCICIQNFWSIGIELLLKSIYDYSCLTFFIWY